ncbi:IS21 family transposase [Thalassotalea ponticola]|uniref:IS21 family transposase n=1 Tax=Thalassotalea ponticola TaxID=1523392 RepID=UPI0025B5CA87|nr:IS21 family transposase [Thalassotalea ponticola]MDN3651674.1 IS21 family transposase [Thalassotalea ponticola]
MSLLSVLRRWHFKDGKSQRQIARETGLSRNTVKKYLEQDCVEPNYPKRETVSKLDEYKDILSKWLDKDSKRRRKERRTAKRLHKELVELGFTGSYDRVCAFVRQWREEKKIAAHGLNKKVFVPLEFAPGEAFQFDWGENYAYVGHRKIKLQVAHFKLSHAKAFFLRAYLTQTHEMLFDAHQQAFRVFGGVAERGIYDNMKTAVDKVGKGKKRDVNRRFQAMAGHYLFEAEFCNPAAGWEKGQVEKNVRDARGSIWPDAPRCKTLDELNLWLEQKCQAQWQEIMHPSYDDRTVEQVWLEEKKHLMKVISPFDGFIEHTKKVSSTCLVNFERNRYSVPASFANRFVSVRTYPDRLEFIAEEHKVAAHKRQFNRDHGQHGVVVYDWHHYLLVAQRKPGALRNGAPFKEQPECFKHLQSILLKREGGDREMVDILSLVLHHDEKLVEKAVELSLNVGLTSKQHVINCLNRLMDKPEPKPLPVKTALKLREEPTTDTSVYEQLRGRKHAH